MNAVAPLHRTNPGDASPSERDDQLKNQAYADSLVSPLSPSSDFSFSRYQGDSSDRGMAFTSTMANSASSVNLPTRQRSSAGSNSANTPIRDSVVIEHYMALKRYLSRTLSGDSKLSSILFLAFKRSNLIIVFRLNQSWKKQQS